MENNSQKSAGVTGFLIFFGLSALIFSAIFFVIRGDHLSNMGAILLGLAVAFVVSVAWALLRRLLP